MEQLQVFEQIQFLCPECRIPGHITEFYINPTMALLRGKCPKCGNSGNVNAIDLLALAESIERQVIIVKRSSWQRRIAEITKTIPGSLKEDHQAPLFPG